MPTFAYSARPASGGDIKSGEVNLPSKDDVLAHLHKQKLIPVSVREKSKEISFQFGTGITTRDIVIFTRQFATMINAGLPLVQSLDILAEQTENPAFRKTIGETLYDIESGHTLADAMGKHPKVFTELFVNMVAAGEAGGILDTILLRLATFLEKNDALIRKIKGAMIYPGVIFSVAGGGIVILLLFVIPTFQTMFAAAGIPRPLPPRIVIGMSAFLQGYWWACLACIIGFFVGIKQFYATVYLADDIKHERKVALKVVKPELAAVVGAERFRTRTPWMLILVGGLLAALAPRPTTAQSQPVLIRAGKIHTATNGVIRDGEILIRDGVIQEVGTTVDAPADAQQYWAEVVIPGMIDAHAHLALDRAGRSRIPGPFTPEWKAVDNLDLEDPMIQVALSGGVTSVIARSGSGIISSGQAVALKMKSTPGPSMILKPYVDLKMAVRPLINLRPGETPQTVMGWYATADDYFRRAELYMARQEGHAQGRASEPPEIDERLEALLPVLRGEVMVHAHSHYPSEIMMVMRLARKYGFIDRLALAHAEEVFPIIDLLAETEIIPVIGPMMIVQYYNDPEPINLLEELLDAGVTASIQTDMSNQFFKDFREYGAFLARHGLTDQQALEVMTINGAKAMMLDDRVGSIEVGKDADLVLLDGHFLDLTADRIERVFIDGQLEYERGDSPQPDRPREVGPFTPLRNEIGPDDESFAITGAHVFTVSDGAIENATIVVEEGRFTRVEAGGAPPAGLPVMEAGGRVVMPGTIIARAFANDWIGDLKWQVQNDEITEPIVPEMNALYAVDPWFPSYRINTTIGVTAINVTPGTLNLIGGNGVVVKTPGLDFEEMVRREPSSMVMSLTSGTARYWAGASRIPVTLESASAMIREALGAASQYAQGGREYDQRHEALLPLLRGEVPALIHADRVGEIREAMSIAEDYGLRLVVTGGVEAHELAAELAAADVGVVLGNSGTLASNIRGGGDGWSIDGPAILSRAGVKVAFFGPGASRRASPIGRLGGEPILNSAWAFRNGVPEVEALKMATLNAAEMLDMADRIGSIAVGKDADFVVLEGHPFDYRVVPSYVFVDGRLEAERR